MTGGRNPRRASTGLGPSSHHHPAPSGSSKPRSEATYSQDDSDDSQESPDSRIEDPLSSYAPNFVDMMADLSTAEAFVFEKSDYISKWQESAHTGQDARERDHIRTIYRACTGYYSLLLPDILDSSKCEDYEKSNLRRTYHLLREWGAAYGVMEGRLDQLAEEGSDVTETIFSFLIEISRILAQRIPALTGKWKMSDTDLMLRAQSHLQNLIRRAQDLTSSESFDETREGDDDPLDDSLQECLSDLLDYVQLLGELHPSIEAHIPLLEDAPGLTPDEAADRAAHLLFSDMIRSKFSAAPDTLVDLLGRLNLDRFTRLAESREKNQKNEFEIPETASIELKSSSFLDSGLGSSLPPGSSQAPPSMSVPSLHLSGMTDSLPGAPSRVTSSIVASSLAFTVAGNSRSKLPRMPANSPTKPFNCHYCAKKVSFSTKRDWHKHLLSDLQPYSCLIDIDNCPLTKEAFPTRNDYLKHLKLDHKLDSQTPPMVCPLCRETTESGMPGIAKHLANHLEDIAIAASPLDIDSEEDSDADSSKAQGGKGEGSPLPTITEDTEDKPITRPYLSHEGVFIAPNCAICNAPVIGEDQDCGCEERQLKIAFEQSEHRIFAVKLKDARLWAVDHARQYILSAFERLSTIRKQTHTAHLQSLPHYSIYMLYNGHPPIDLAEVTALQVQITEAQSELQRGINADWRATVLRYPEFLDYFYNLVEVHIPPDSDPRVVHPPFAAPGSQRSSKETSRRATPQPWRP